MNHLKKMQQQAKSGNKTKVENDADIVVESEETQNTTGDSDNLIELEESVCNISVDDGENGKMQTNSAPFTYAGAIKKNNRKTNNFSEIDDVAGSPIRSKPKTVFHDRPQLQEISHQILRGIKVMVIMRGAPGSGKSYLAKEIVDATTCDEYCQHIFSSDDFFYDSHGNYQFAPHRLGEVHENNRQRVNHYACRGWSPIIVDNTNMKVWEMKSYFDIAMRCGYLVYILEANTSWSKSPGRLAMKNSHGVPKESIERMLNGYEPATVSSVMESFGLNYTMTMPQYRQFPPISPTSNTMQLNNNISTPKSQRTSIRNLPKKNNFEAPSQVPDLVQYETVEEAFRNVDKATEWTAFDQERVEFWNNNATQASHVPSAKEQRTPKSAFTPSRSATVTKNELHSNLFAILKENNENVMENKAPAEEEPKDMKKVLQKHRKNCRNENDSFAQIRQIFPSVSLDILWDLFEKCEGDGDWTMDILLKDETRIDEYDNTDGNMDGRDNDFVCDCDGGSSKTVDADQINVPSRNAGGESSPMTWQRVSRQQYNTNQKSNRVAINTEEQLAAKRMIEESFQIGDEHYSNHTRKIRNFRRGVVTSPESPESATNTEEGACAIDVAETDSNEKDDELLEVNLGMDLVCQLDSVFGVEAYQRDALENLKTNVFMPKSLAQQLYALWIESMYNQLEEQRQKSIREDAEFARQLQSQQNYPGLHKFTKPPSDLKDIMEMEYALAAYRTEMSEWKSKTPQDLAVQMTHDKLCRIFPHIDRETLVEVLAAHNNKFSETVDVLKHTLSGKSEEKIANEGRQLFEEVQTEVEATVSICGMVGLLTLNSKFTLFLIDRLISLNRTGQLPNCRWKVVNWDQTRQNAWH